MPTAAAPAQSQPTKSPSGLAAVRLLALPVFREEDWPSIHLCADMLVQHWPCEADTPVNLTTAAMPYRQRFSRLPGLGRKSFCRNADRLLNRLWDYPRSLRRQRAEFDAFHICDHSYSQLAHTLPIKSTGVLCQDLDTFRCLLSPRDEPRPRWFRRMTQRILDGFRQVAVVFHTTNHVRAQILEHGLIDPDRLVHAPLGIAPEFAELARQRPDDEGPNAAPYLLHVGSCIPRKRIDVLLRVFAAVRRQRPDVALVKVGGEFTAEQRALIAELGLDDAVQHRLGLSRTELAALYRRAAATLVTSDREGFGLPVIEALACGSVVVANDIPPLREGGGDAAVYRSINNVESWAEAVLNLLDDGSPAPSVEQRRTQALRFTWERHAQVIADTYARIVAGQAPSGSIPASTKG
ncbi:MAG: glycosyltransferase [Planctomycetaceae bacterium]|nr:glycosyltransferase [Planctomycetaceae bacterium]